MKAKREKKGEATIDTMDTNKKLKTKKLNELILLQKEKNRRKESRRSVLKKNDIESRNRARTIGSDLSDRQRLKQNMLIRTQN
jgi:hypothetical protein